jgi:LCP family protein required for cell wall assembly
MSRPDHPDEPARRPSARQQPDRSDESAPDAGAKSDESAPDAGMKTARRRRVLARVAGTLAVVVTLAVVSGSLFFYSKYREVWHSIKRQDVSRDLVHIAKPPPPDPRAVNILLIGSDSRSGGNGAIGGRDGIDGQRSDTVMVLHVAPGAHNAVVLSFPRDSVVPVYACTAEKGAIGQTAVPGEIEQINATFAYGGPGCLWKTVEETTHIHIDDFIELSFVGFEKVIDDVGGVSVCLPEAVDDPTSGLHLSAGRHRIHGPQALAFWRTREGLGSGMDTERIQRDQFLMAALLQGMENSGVLTSTSKMASVIADAARHMTTDTQLTQSRMLSIADSLRGLSSKSVQFIEVPWVLYPGNTNWVQWQQPQAHALFSAIAHDTKLPTKPGSSGSAGRSATVSRRGSSVGSELATVGRAKMLTGSTVAGLAGSTAANALWATPRPTNLTRTYGGIRGNVGLCQDKKAFSVADVGH